MFIVEVISGTDENVVNNIVLINRDSFPGGWKYGADQEYYREMLTNRKNIIVLLKDSGKTIGCLLAMPHNDAVGELKNDDPLIQEDALRYYLETVAILPEYRGKNGFSAMFSRLCQELKIRKINKISLHARIPSNFSEIIQKKMTVTQIRRINRWKYCNYEEPVDYLEGRCNF